MSISWKAALGFVVGGVLLGSVASVAAQTESPSPTPVPGAQQPAPLVRHGMKGPGHGPGGGAMRSESVFPGTDGGAVRTVRTDQGELKAIDGNTLTIAEQDGTTAKVTVADDTKIGRDHEQASLGDLKVGDHVHAIREKTGDAAYATTAVMAMSAERYAEMEQRRQQMEQQRQACAADPSQCPAPGLGRGHGWFGGPPATNPSPEAGAAATAA